MDNEIKDFANSFEVCIKDVLHLKHAPSSRLIEAMRYSCLEGGKRIRPFLLYKSYQMVKKNQQQDDALNDAILKLGCAVELVHCYSLIHDDLPGMDNDDMRRGRPTLHKKYDEATAICAGDALQTLAFTTIVDANIFTNADDTIRATKILADAIGLNGMVGGQMLDMEAENKEADELTINDVKNIQFYKTGALIVAACKLGAILANATKEEFDAITKWAAHLGEAYQITDDLLDVFGSSELVGKQTQKDGAAGKITFVTLLGVDGAKERLANLENNAKVCLQYFNNNDKTLQNIWNWLLKREF